MVRTQRAFTLIELLVVITIIGALMALLMPAAQAIRASAQKMTCATHMTDVGKAILTYTSKDSKGRFPGYVQMIGTTTKIPSSWAVQILPYLEKDGLYQQWRQGNPVSEFIEIFWCPSYPLENPTDPKLSYVANCGMSDALFASAPIKDKAANGLFFDRSSEASAVSMSKNQIPDGENQTLMLSENINSKGWSEKLTGLAMESVVGFVWFKDDSSAPNGNSPKYLFRKINGGKTPEQADSANPKPQVYDLARPSSNHSGGVNACFASGTTKWLREDIAYNVYQQLMSPDGANARDGTGVQPLPPYTNPTTGKVEPFYRLNEADYN